jgi:uncharacterized membrane protein YeaQ/YmgE (transglycosylase-associated protein family)
VHLTDERMIAILLVGVAAGYLAGRVAQGSGAGPAGNAAIGIVGALIGDWLLPRFHIHLVGGVLGLVVNAAVGAAVLLLVLRFAGADGWGGGRQTNAFRR